MTCVVIGGVCFSAAHTVYSDTSDKHAPDSGDDEVSCGKHGQNYEHEHSDSNHPR